MSLSYHFGTLKAKAAVRDVGRTQCEAYAEADSIAKRFRRNSV